MAHKTSVLRFSVGPALARGCKSDLFRRMVTTYKAEREEAEFVSLQRKMARRVCNTDVHIEEEVERIVFEDR